MDQWNRTENAKINPQLCGQLVFDRGGKNIQQQMLLGKLDSNIQKNETGPLTAYTK